MRPILLYFLTLLLLNNYALAQASHTPMFSAPAIQQLLSDTYQELVWKHPGTYRYTQKAVFDRYVDSLKSTITDSLSELEVYRKLKPFIARVRCLHTDVSLPQSYTDSLNQLPDLLPLQVELINGHLYISRNFSGDSTIHMGSEIVAINGRPVDSLLAEILPAIATDGYNETLPARAVYHLFPLLYRNLIQLTDSYKIEVRLGGIKYRYTMAGKSYTALAGNGFLKEPVPEKQLAFTVQNNTGFLTVHSFAASDIKAAGQKFSSFMKKTFTTLEEQHIPDLVVDLRDNTGGSDANAALFCRYFFDTAFRYWDRIVVTDSIAREVKGIVKLFYRKPVYKNGEWLWLKGRLTREFDFYKVQRPAPHNYKGRVYVLINGFCMSSCADVAAILSHHHKAVFFGEETGGGYQGNSSGMMPHTSLAPTRLQLTVPLQGYYNAVAADKNYGHGTLPDVPVQAGASEKDATMEVVLQHIRQRGK
ncbi:hypothetical protein HNQ91_003156 [Filimonas zeae]|nr:S41 family peptidase [Filimonas zeae]MDR6340091.1 hypothetical protein [Filimonas zeae]